MACPRHVRLGGNLGNSDCLVFAGLAHDNRLCSVLLGALLPKTMLLADRGYDADWIRGLAREQGARADIPPKRNRKDPICFRPRKLHRDRWIIGRTLAETLPRPYPPAPAAAAPAGVLFCTRLGFAFPALCTSATPCGCSNMSA